MKIKSGRFSVKETLQKLKWRLMRVYNIRYLTDVVTCPRYPSGLPLVLACSLVLLPSCFLPIAAMFVQKCGDCRCRCHCHGHCYSSAIFLNFFSFLFFLCLSFFPSGLFSFSSFLLLSFFLSFTLLRGQTLQLNLKSNLVRPDRLTDWLLAWLAFF